MVLGPDGLVAGIRYLASPNCDDRPQASEASLLVVHSISLPPGVFTGDAVERFFTNRLDAGAHPYFEGLRDLRVSAHFLVRRSGELVQFVPVGRRAWHAGESVWRGRSRCNDFSIGVELEGEDCSSFEPAQYRKLAALARMLRAALPLSAIAGHSDIAPSRKTDPGPLFDWARCLSLLSRD
jgi:N-acetyl-anhydromuramoyl-L-alanine amidase